MNLWRDKILFNWRLLFSEAVTWKCSVKFPKNYQEDICDEFLFKVKLLTVNKVKKLRLFNRVSLV